MKFSESYSLRIYNDMTSDYLQISQTDVDELVEITSYVGSHAEARLVVAPEMAERLITGIKKVIELNKPPMFEIKLNAEMPAMPLGPIIRNNG